MSNRNTAVLFAFLTILAGSGIGFSARAGNHVLTFIFLIIVIITAVISGIYFGMSRG